MSGTPGSWHWSELGEQRSGRSTGWQSQRVWPTTSRNVTQGVTRTHRAVDIGGKIGDPIYAPMAGTITSVRKQTSGYGNNLRILTNDGVEIILAHLSGFASNVQEGLKVAAGQVVGLMGSSGHSSGPHLHIEYRTPGPDTFSKGYTSTRTALDPWKYLQGSGDAGKSSGLKVSKFSYTKEGPKQTETGSWGWLTGGSGGSVGVPGGLSDEQKEEIEAKIRAGGLIRDKNGASITLANTPLGAVTVPQPGETAKRLAIFLFASVVAVVSLGSLLGRSPVVMAGVRAAAGATPVGQGLKAAAKAAK